MRMHIESLAHGGDGVAHLDDGRAAFVADACPGDTVEAEVLDDKGRYVRARITEIVEPSPDRLDPPCPYFGECGGCQWQHVRHDVQLKAKTAAVRDALERIGHFEAPPIAACLSADAPYGYRNKIELVVSQQSGRLVLGFHRRSSSEVIPIEACLLLPERARNAPKALQGALRYITSGRDVALARVGMRVAANTADLEVALWTRPGPFPRKLAATAISDAVGATGVVRCMFKGPEESRDVVGVEVLKGRGAWRERLGGQSLLVSAPSFFQVNTPMAERLADVAVDLLEPAGHEVLDVFAGVGTFTLPLAARTHVTAIESSGAAITDLKRNLANAVLDADIAPGDATFVMRDLEGPVERVLLDPPRSGLHPDVVRELSRLRPDRLVYVSCDPATLARDASLLTQTGLGLVSAQPLDLFPQTYHVETVAVFERAQGL